MRTVDWIALVLLVGCLALIGLGHNETLLGILVLVAGFYFGRRLS